MSMISETKAATTCPSQGKEAEQGGALTTNPLAIRGFREFIFSRPELREFLRGMEVGLSGAQIAAWFGLSALGLLSYPSGRIRYLNEKQIADLLGVEDDALISTIEKAQAWRKVQVFEEALVPCRIAWLDDPDHPGSKFARYNPSKVQFWGEYRNLIFLDKLFPHNKFLTPELLPEEVPISKRPRLDKPGLRYFFDDEAKVGDRDLLEELGNGLTLWKENTKLLRCCVGTVRDMLLEECQSLPPIPALRSTREKRA